MAAMTLDEIKKGMSDKVFGQIVDIFLRESAILQMLQFDDCVSASGGGSTMKYKYLRKVLPATAEFRKLNGSYTASAATKKECEAALAIMGGAVQMDRVLNKVAGNWDNLAYQIEEHIKAVVSLFHYTLINGDATATASGDHPEFEGLDSMLAGTTTEYGAKGSIDLSTIANLKNNADEFYEALVNKILGGIETMCNGVVKGINKLLGGIEDVANATGELLGFDPVSITLSEVSLPRLAKGTVVTKPTFAEIGEDGAEAIVPLERNTQWIQRVSEEMSNQGGFGGSSEVVELLKVIVELLKIIIETDGDFSDTLLEAIKKGLRLDINKREFARLVREV